MTLAAMFIPNDTKRIAIVDTRNLPTPVEVTIRYQYDNHLGSACLELDGSGAIVSYEEYYPFGSSSYRAGRNETETSLKRYRYVGKERDEETGLYYYGARYYAAWLCRFVSVDPLQLKYPHYTPYQYAGNKPVSYIDLDGLEEAPSKNEKFSPRFYKIFQEGLQREPSLQKQNLSRTKDADSKTNNDTRPIYLPVQDGVQRPKYSLPIKVGVGETNFPTVNTNFSFEANSSVGYKNFEQEVSSLNFSEVDNTNVYTNEQNVLFLESNITIKTKIALITSDIYDPKSGKILFENKTFPVEIKEKSMFLDVNVYRGIELSVGTREVFVNDKREVNQFIPGVNFSVPSATHKHGEVDFNINTDVKFKSNAINLKIK